MLPCGYYCLPVEGAKSELLHTNRLGETAASGQWLWAHVLSLSTFRELPLCPYCVFAKAKRSSFMKSVNIPDHIGSLLFANEQGPFEVESLEESVYKVNIIEARQDFSG